jgi:hypothetical protein
MNLTHGPRCHNFFAVYDVSRPDTFESLNIWLEEVEQFACSGGRGDKNSAFHYYELNRVSRLSISA